MSMSNFESAIRRKLNFHQQLIAGAQQQIAKLEAQPPSAKRDSALASATNRLAEANEAHLLYVLNTVPYVKQYFHCDHAATITTTDHETTTTTPSQQIPCMTTNNGSGQCTWMLDQGQVQRKGSVFRNYMNHVEQQAGYNDTPEAMRQYDICTDCEGEPCLIIDREYMVCPKCGRCYPASNLSYENLSFEQQISDIVHVACYRRSNHFSEWLSKLQAREVTKIPDDVMTAVKVELKKHRLTEPCQITQAKIKDILKKLKFSKYYEHVPSIHSIITQTSAPKFPSELEEKLKQLFDEIQEPFERFKGAKRSNMLSYGFLLYKFCELLGEDNYLPYLPLLKSSTKLWECDQVWKKICADRQWEFVPTV